MPLQPADIQLDDDDFFIYQQKGYWISPVLFNDQEVEAMRYELERICSGQRDYDCFFWLSQPKFTVDDPAVRQVVNGWWVNKVMRKMVQTPVIGYIGSLLMNTKEVRLWHDQMIWKPGLNGIKNPDLDNNIGWHQDYPHWQCANTMNFCTAWIALQDTDESNGGMQVVEGSHQWGFRHDANTFGEKDLESLQKKYCPPNMDWKTEPCILKAGQASFHHSLTYHGSGPNLSNQPRLSFVVHMMPKDCGFNSQGRHHPNADLMGPDVKDGDLFDGPYFPRLWPSN
ncbi:phytanoyl-CoA dioxygenase [Candidatus Poribacteria bacterium]|nr:phytanoyl-CoA dioxygenase [Candidatus Poribacteria bacterium]